MGSQWLIARLKMCAGRSIKTYPQVVICRLLAVAGVLGMLRKLVEACRPLFTLTEVLFREVDLVKQS